MILMIYWFLDKNNRLIVQWQLFLLINDCVLGKLKYCYSYWLLALRHSSYQKKNESRRRSSLKTLSAPLNVFYYWRLYAGLIRLGQRDLHLSQWGQIFSRLLKKSLLFTNLTPYTPLIHLWCARSKWNMDLKIIFTS